MPVRDSTSRGSPSTWRGQFVSRELHPRFALCDMTRGLAVAPESSSSRTRDFRWPLPSACVAIEVPAVRPCRGGELWVLLAQGGKATPFPTLLVRCLGPSPRPLAHCECQWWGEPCSPDRKGCCVSLLQSSLGTRYMLGASLGSGLNSCLPCFYIRC